MRDLFREGSQVSPRYLLMLAGQLPESSAFTAGRRGGPQYRAWTSSTHMLAALVNLTYAANRQRGGKKSVKPIVEPPKAGKTRRTMTVAELIARQKDQKPELPF